MKQVLVVGAGPRRSRMIDRGLEDANVRVTRKDWPRYLNTKGRSTPALVIYDLAGEDAPHLDELDRLPDTVRETGVLYLAGRDSASLEGLTGAFQHPNVDFILAQEMDNPCELRMRATRLLAKEDSYTITGPAKRSNATPHNAFQHTVPDLHASNGRLDARAVSRLFGVSLAALARALGRSEQAVHKTPMAEGIQTALSVYERIASILLRLAGSETGLRAWMHSSNRELEDETPVSLLLGGEGQVVADLLEDVMHGEPA